jgi:hypothetical protein
MNVADIISEWGAYYLNHGQNLKDLVRQLYRKSTTEALFTTMTTDDTIIRKSESRFTRILQPFQKAFTPIGTLSFTPTSIPLFEMKIDYQERPDEISNSWLSFLEGDDLDRTKWPLIKWLLTAHLMPQAEQDWELNEIYKGVFVAPTPGTAGAVGTTSDGIKIQINNWIDAGRTEPILTGAIETDPEDFVTQIEEFCEGIPELYRDGEQLDLAMNTTLELRYRKGIRTKYNQNYLQKANTTSLIDFENIKVVGCPSMAGSSKIWTSPNWNKIVGLKKKNNQKAVEVEKVDRLVKVYSDWYKGVGFIIPELIFTNDLELPA